VVDDLAERGTPAFYREQAARLTALAAIAGKPELRVELLEMASVFQKMADHSVAANRNTGSIDAETA
jgi:hypothetical protein